MRSGRASRRWAGLLVVLGSLALLTAFSPAGHALRSKALPETWQIVDLGATLGASGAGAFDVNSLGQSAGAMPTGATDEAGSPVVHAVLWDALGNRLDLGTLGGTNSYAYGVNDAGQVVGSSETGELTDSGKPVRRAFLWDGKGMRAIGNPNALDATAYAINDAGAVVGQSDSHAFYWSSAEGFQELGTLPGDPVSTARAVNNDGVVAGYSGYHGTPEQPARWHAFLWNAGTGLAPVRRLPDYHTAVGLTNAGSLLGNTYRILRDREQRRTYAVPSGAFLRTQNGRMRPLPPTLFAASVNDREEIVGEASFKAVLLRGEHLLSLGLRIPQFAGWSLQSARDIGSGDYVVGRGTYHLEAHAFLLVPDAQPNCATDVTESVEITGEGWHIARNRQSSELRLKIKNVGAAKLEHLELVLDGLNSGLGVTNATGTTACALPAGSPYVTVDAAGDSALDPGESAILTVGLAGRVRSVLYYNPRALAGSGVR